MKMLSIAFKDLQILIKDRGTLILLFLLPLLFVVVFSGALGAIGQSEEGDTRIGLPVVDMDGGEAAASLIAGLDAAGGVVVEPYAEVEGAALLAENEIARLLTIPTGFTARMTAGQPTTVRLVSRPEADPEETEVVRLVVDGVARDMSLEVQILSALQQMGEMQASAPQGAMAFSVERMQAQARSQFERSQAQPLVAVVQKLPGQEAEVEEQPDLKAFTLPGMTVLFVFMTAQTTARSIYDEKRLGSFRRLLAAPMSKAAILGGKVLRNWLTGLLQVAVVFAFGIYGLRLFGMTPASLGPRPLLTLVAVLLVTLCSSALGILIAALARTESQIGGISTLLMWVLGILGGAFVPLFLLEQFLGPVPMFIPHYWANRALVDLMVRGLGIADVALDLAVLAGFSALFFGIGLWRFDYD
jgi:ABC-2 type transport system permease protein